MIEIRLLVIPNTFKRQAEENDHHWLCAVGKFRRNLVFYGLGPNIPITLYCSSKSPLHPSFARFQTMPAATQTTSLFFCCARASEDQSNSATTCGPPVCPQTTSAMNTPTASSPAGVRTMVTGVMALWCDMILIGAPFG